MDSFFSATGKRARWVQRTRPSVVHIMRHAIIACSTQRLWAPLVTQRLQTTSFRGDDMSDDDRATQAEELIARMKSAQGRAPRRRARRIAPGTVYSGRRVDCQATICHCPPLLT